MQQNMPGLQFIFLGFICKYKFNCNLTPLCHTSLRVLPRLHPCARAHTHTNTNTRTRTHTCTHAHIHTHTHTHTHTQPIYRGCRLGWNILPHTYTHIHTRTNTRTHNTHAHTRSHTHTHTTNLPWEYTLLGHTFKVSLSHTHTRTHTNGTSPPPLRGRGTNINTIHGVYFISASNLYCLYYISHQSPGSGRMGVICALVDLFPSEDDKTNFTPLSLPCSTLRNSRIFRGRNFLREFNLAHNFSFSSFSFPLTNLH